MNGGNESQGDFRDGGTLPRTRTLEHPEWPKVADILGRVRPPVDTIAAPPFPRDLEWCNVAPLRMDQQRGRPVLIEFFDVCRPQSLRTLPYLRAWHERYAADGLRVISVHCPGFAPSRDAATVRAAVERLGIEHPVCLDQDLELWDLYDNEGWPARYLWDQQGLLAEFHFGEGGYAETELAVQELLGVQREPLGPLRPEDDPDALIVVPTADQEGPYSGPYVAGAVWLVVSGAGVVTVSTTFDGSDSSSLPTVEGPEPSRVERSSAGPGSDASTAAEGAGAREVRVDGGGCVQAVDHGRSVEGVLAVAPGEGVTVHATCFTPGVAA